MDKRFRTLWQWALLVLASGVLAGACFYLERQAGRQLPLAAAEGLGILALLAATAGPALALWRQTRARRLLFLEARGRLGAIVETSLDAIISKDLNGVVTSWNPAAAKLFGFSREEAIGRSLATLIIPPERKQEEADILAALRAGHPLELPDTERLRKDGTLLPVSVSVAPFPDEHGTVVGASVIMRDISMLKKSARALARANEELELQVRARTEELAKARRQLQGVFDSATEVSVIATATDGTIELFNHGAERMLGYRAQELVGAGKLAILFSETEIAARARELSEELSRPVAGFEALVAVALQAGAETRVWTCRRNDGRTFPISLTVTVIHGEAGEVSGFLAIGFDASKQREVEESLLLAKNLAEQASRSKSQFVANMSHEIRTPMNAVLGLLQVLHRTRLDAEQLDCVNKASQAGKTLLGLINDVLDFSKLEAEHLILDQHHFELDAMLRDVAASLASVRDKALQVMIDAPPALPQALVGDSLRLSQVLVNLMGNAIKFTAQGHVLLRVELLGRREGHARLRFSVRDTGIGIPDRQREQVFGEFTQAESSTTRRFGGTGLGLAISRRLVALMGGTLQLESRENVGSCFWFDIDLLAGPQAQGPAPERGRLVAAAANPVMRELLARLLPELGWQADIVANGEQLLAYAAQQAQAGAPYRLALQCDGGPGDAALSVASALQRLDAQARPALVSLAGQDAALQQPFTAAQLDQALQAALQRDDGAAPVPQEQRSAARRLAGLRILLVEDQALNRLVAERLLSYEGATVLQADGGASGVAIANRHCGELDLILMDLQMPDMDGFSATKAIQSNPATAHIPVIAMTANASVMDRKACLNAGMVDHIGKPIDIEQVVRVLSGHISRSLELPAVGSRATRHGTAGLEAMDSLLERFGGSLDVYSMALAGFEQSGGEILDAVERHCAEGDAVQAASGLHALKGVAATLGATAFADRCAMLEQALKGGGDLAVVCGAAVRQQLRDELASCAQQLLRRLPAAAPAAPRDDALRHWLEEIQSMLDFGSLDALDKLEDLLPQVEDGLRPQIASALEAVARLQFEQAAACLSRAGQALEAQ